MAGPAFDYPLRVRDGRFVTVEQGSTAHLEVQAIVALSTPVGAIEAQPETGLRDLIGTMGPVGPRLLEVLSDTVPSVDFLADEDASRLSERLSAVAVRVAQDAGEG
jgi:hypothetical protein